MTEHGNNHEQDDSQAWGSPILLPWCGNKGEQGAVYITDPTHPPLQRPLARVPDPKGTGSAQLRLARQAKLDTELKPLCEQGRAGQGRWEHCGLGISASTGILQSGRRRVCAWTQCPLLTGFSLQRLSRCSWALPELFQLLRALETGSTMVHSTSSNLLEYEPCFYPSLHFSPFQRP